MGRPSLRFSAQGSKERSFCDQSRFIFLRDPRLDPLSFGRVRFLWGTYDLPCHAIFERLGFLRAPRSCPTSEPAVLFRERHIGGPTRRIRCTARGRWLVHPSCFFVFVSPRFGRPSPSPIPSGSIHPISFPPLSIHGDRPGSEPVHPPNTRWDRTHRSDLSPPCWMNFA